MESLITKISEMGLDTMMNKSRDELIAKDKAFLKLEKQMSDAEFLYSHLKLEEERAKIIDDYIHIISYSRGAYADLSYAAGVKDTIVLLNALGVLKD